MSLDLSQLPMSGRCIVLDTETTGMPIKVGEPSDHRLVDIAAVELIDRKVTGRTFQVYIDPVREVDEGAVEVHGNTRDDLVILSGGKKFPDVAESFSEFVNGDPLIIHNAEFDMGFLDHEYDLCGMPKLTDQVNGKIFDTLTHAKIIRPGRRNNLDTLCGVYNVNNQHRELHGALVDSYLLADVFLKMTVKQYSLVDENAKKGNTRTTLELKYPAINADLASQLVVISPSRVEKEKHNKIAKRIRKESDDNSMIPSF